MQAQDVGGVKAQVVDTNVLVAAEELCDSAKESCIKNCILRLKDLRASGLVLIDGAGLIMDEYRRNLEHAGQPRTGWAFYKWLCSHEGARARHVTITPVSGPDEDFVEFPHTPALEGFDRSDRKFVAVAIASSLNPPIANATDSDWANYHRALSDVGVTVQFLCPEDCAPA